jgi:hypothetical protein
VSSPDKLDIKSVSNSKLKIREYEDQLYDLIVLMCLSEDKPNYLNSQVLLDYFDKGGQLLVVGDVDTSGHYQQLLQGLGLHLHSGP